MTKIVPVKDYGLRGMDLLGLVLEVIEANPEHHNQNTWGKTKDQNVVVDLEEKISCGMTCCIGGWAVALCGLPLIASYGGTGVDVTTNSGGYVDIEEKASELLGLTYQEAQDLFYSFDKASAIRMAHQIAEARGVILFEDEDEEEEG